MGVATAQEMAPREMQKYLSSFLSVLPWSQVSRLSDSSCFYHILLVGCPGTGMALLGAKLPVEIWGGVIGGNQMQAAQQMLPRVQILLLPCSQGSRGVRWAEPTLQAAAAGDGVRRSGALR